MGIVDSALSAIAGLRASAALGRASRLQSRGDLEGALAQARHGLSILGATHVRRKNPSEGSVLTSLTVLAESIGTTLREPSASSRDLRDSIEFLKQLPLESSVELRSYLPFLEARLRSSAE